MVRCSHLELTLMMQVVQIINTFSILLGQDKNIYILGTGQNLLNT